MPRECIILDDSPYCPVNWLYDRRHVRHAPARGYPRSKPGRGNAHDVKAWLLDYKRRKGCCVCGESDPICLHFHHRDPSIKRFNLSAAHRQEMAVVREEVAKCDILCANCHAKIHAGALVLKEPDDESSLKGSSTGLRYIEHGVEAPGA